MCLIWRRGLYRILYGSVHNIQFAAHIFYNGDAKTIAEVKQTQVERQVLEGTSLCRLPLARHDETRSPRSSVVFIERVGVCMLTTHSAQGLRARPVEARPDRTAGIIWFVTDLRSSKEHEIEVRARYWARIR